MRNARRLPSRRRRLGRGGVLAVIVLSVSVLIAAGTWYAVRDRGASSGPLAEQLSRLRADNGLYFHPKLASEQPLSLADSAYGLQVSALAGDPQVAPWAHPATAGVVARGLADSHVWGLWYVYQIEQATGERARNVDFSTLTGTYGGEGYLQDTAGQPADDAVRLATTAAGLLVARDRGVGWSASATAAMRSWLGTQAGQLANPYQACNLATAVTALGDQVPGQVAQSVDDWWARTGSRVTHLDSAESVLDVYGYVCATRATGGVPADTAAALRRQLEPRLARTDDAFIGYHLAAAWIGAGGDRLGLRPLADLLHARRNGTGLLSAKVERVGTLESAYLVARLREARHLDQRDPDLVKGVTRALRQDQANIDQVNTGQVGAGQVNTGQVNTGQVNTGQANLAEAAMILRLAGRDDPAIDRSAISQLTRSTPGAVTSSNVLAWKMWHDFAVQLGSPLPPLRVESWSGDSRENRFKLWTLLATVSGAERAAVPAPMIQESSRIKAELQVDASSMNMKELRAAVEALRNFRGGEQIPQTVAATVGARKGCGAYSELFRSEADPATCDLSATVDGYWLQDVIGSQK